MNLLQINTTVNSGSTGRIAEDIGKVLIQHGHGSFIAFGRGNRPSLSKLIRIGNPLDVYLHVLYTRIFDKHGFASVSGTKKLISKIELLKPDAIGLHNLHGYYINLKILFEYLSLKKIPVLWTLYDCWSFTGHCSYFDDIQCEKWKTHCFKCPKYRNYPSAWVDNSQNNFSIKKELFSRNDFVNLLVHSQWLGDLVSESFLGHLPVHVIPSGIDLDVFTPGSIAITEKFNLSEKKIVLGCASVWTERKGLQDIVKLSILLPDEYKVVVIGVNPKQKSALPPNVIGIVRTENTKQLAEWYSAASVFVNPTYQDNFPTTNIEALACGTPVVTYNTGGSPEAVDEQTGRVVEKGDIAGLLNATQEVCSIDRDLWRKNCRKRAEQLFDKNKQFAKYIDIYKQLLNV